jgi:hypothetical protein
VENLDQNPLMQAQIVRKFSSQNRSFLNIGIVGLGAAGQSAAIFMAQKGHNVEVYNRKFYKEFPDGQ